MAGHVTLLLKPIPCTVKWLTRPYSLALGIITSHSHCAPCFFCQKLFPADSCMAHPTGPSALCLNITLSARSVLTTRDHFISIYSLPHVSFLHRICHHSTYYNFIDIFVYSYWHTSFMRVGIFICSLLYCSPVPKQKLESLKYP